MPLLISGPPGAPLSEVTVERFRATPGALYLVPTATMADHLRNSSIRAGFAVRPNSIQTLAKFLESWAPIPAAPAAMLELLIERALEKVKPARFRKVADFPGVIHALADLFDLVPGNRMPDDVGRVFSEAERDMKTRGFAPRHVRLAAAADRIAQGDSALPKHIFLDGFFKLAAGESKLIAALSRRADVTISLPNWKGTERSRETFLDAGFDELPVAKRDNGARRQLIRALNIEREAEEIARRILLHVEGGGGFRDVGIVLRSRDPYGPLLETTLARFGIPFRAYFTDSLASHPHVQLLSQLCRAALDNWNQDLLLRAIQMPASGLGGTKAGDDLDFQIRERLPKHGWGQTGSLNAQERLEPGEWAARLAALNAWAPELAVEDGASFDRVQAWRSTGAARIGWEEAMETACLALEGSGRMSLAAFWKQAERVLISEQLRIPDARRNVVHLMDAFEARQWFLPLIFVCGMTEGRFPKYHSEDPIVGDAVLRQAGLDTAADREEEERFLFEMAVTRASVETVLSYPRYDEAGQESLPSFFLQELDFADCDERVRPAPSIVVQKPGPPAIVDEKLWKGLAAQHTHLSASSIEAYLQCPFQFFTRKTLKLVERPKVPRDRLDALLQGSIFHAAVAEWTLRPFLDTAALDGAFETACADKHVPHTYRAEAVRLELLRNFEKFIRDEQVKLHWDTRVEEKFEFPLRDGLHLRGRIDRLDQHGGQALVIDYKYSASDKLKSRVEESAAGNLVQAGVYLLAAQRQFGLEPAGMLFCATKKDVSWEGWHYGIDGLQEIGERRTREGVAELAREAEATVLRVFDEITHGTIAVQPRDSKKCDWCECADMCRVESQPRAKEMSA